MKNTTIIDSEMKGFLTSLILENKKLIEDNFRELDPYKMMSVVSKILPYITTKENKAKKAKETEHEFNECENLSKESQLQLGLDIDTTKSETEKQICELRTTKNTENTEIADEASSLLELESKIEDKESNDDEEVTDEDDIEKKIIDDVNNHTVVSPSRRKKTKRKKKKRKKK